MTRIKYLTLFVLLTATQCLLAQSPMMTVHVKMDSIKTGYTRYKIFMNFCEPKKMTERVDLFSHDTSKIDFASLKADDITCGGYSESNEGLIQLSGERKERPYNYYEYTGQYFAWEKIFIFKIANWSSRGWWPEMYIVLPVKYKSFRTWIDLSDIEFQSGKVIFLNNVNATYNKSGLVIRQSLKNAETVEVKGFPLENLLEKN